MKIAIMTHPLVNNYGGILQAYALTRVLHKMGHDTIILNRKPSRARNVLKSLAVFFHLPPFYAKEMVFRRRYTKLSSFIDSYIQRTKPLFSGRSLWNYCKKENIGGIIVGSDQVWRADYALNFQLNYFFDFVPRGANVKMLSYAASFGLSTWGYSHKCTQKIKELLTRFSGVSVRELSGQKLCENNLGISSKVVLDPTLLLQSADYSQFITSIESEKYVFVYWLGKDEDKLASILSSICPSYRVVRISMSGVEQSSVEDWLSYIKNATYVVTDSFHGCAFSLLFQKQFYLSLNESGGPDRIKSLLSQLLIEEKLTDMEYIIDYKVVNQRLEALRQSSFEFLDSSLS